MLGTRLETWYTEATRLKSSGDEQPHLIGGLQDIMDAVNGGVVGVVVYQANTRLLKANVNPKPRKFQAYKRLVNDASELQVARTNSTDPAVKAVAFAGYPGGRVSLHLVNAADAVRVVRAVVGGPEEIGTCHVCTWDKASLGDEVCVELQQNREIVVEMQPESYSHIYIE